MAEKIGVDGHFLHLADAVAGFFNLSQKFRFVLLALGLALHEPVVVFRPGFEFFYIHADAHALARIFVVQGDGVSSYVAHLDPVVAHAAQ